jgi:hypothetical protein
METIIKTFERFQTVQGGVKHGFSLAQIGNSGAGLEEMREGKAGGGRR